MEQALGIILLALGGLSAASFYVPSCKVLKTWAWETYWITLGFVAWMVMPTVGGLLTTPDLCGILRASLIKGITVAVLGGVMSASMALAYTAGEPIAKATLAAGTLDVFKYMPLLVLALAGGFTTNIVSTMLITSKKKAFGDYVMRPRSTLLLNYFLAAIIIFSNFWGLMLKEWNLVDRRTRACLWLGIFALVVSVVMIGLGNR
jgi:hypothetical protein